MKKINFLIVLFNICLLAAQAQTKFSRLFWNMPEIITTTSIAQTSGGGYVVAGTVKDTAVGSLTDIFLAKFSSVGDTIWTRRIAAPGADVANAVQQTYDGGYIISGQTNSYGQGNYDILLLKTDSLGTVSWAKTYGDNWTNNAFSIRQNTDSGYLVVGNLYPSAAEFFVMRTNVSGDTLWTKTFKLTSSSSSIGAWGEQTSDGGFIVVGRADSSGSNNWVLVTKLTPSGSVNWAKKINLFSSGPSNYHVKQTLDGGYIITAQEYGGFSEPIIVKLDMNGTLVFGKRLLFVLGSYLQSMRVTQLADSTYLLLTSLYNPTQQNHNTYLTRLGQTGDTLWTKKFIDTYSVLDAIFTNDGGIASVGNGGLYKLDSTFSTECTSPFLASGFNISNKSAFNSNPLIGSGTTVANATFTNAGYMPRHLYTSCTPNVPTCVVTVDSASQQNLVVWEESFDTTFIDSYNIYKETSVAGQYALIGNVPHNQLSVFLDIASNPAVHSDRYRVSALWNTYYEPPNIIAGHKTIHLSISPGIPSGVNLIWSSYEGFSYSTYNIWRGNSISSVIIASVPYGTNSYTDLSPPPGDSLYFIEIVHSPCIPTFMHAPLDSNGDETRSSTSYSGTRSNISSNNLITAAQSFYADNFNISVSPNPAMSLLKIETEELKIKEIEIYNTLGEKFIGQQESLLDVSQLNAGMYYVKIFTDKGITSVKFMKL